MGGIFIENVDDNLEQEPLINTDDQQEPLLPPDKSFKPGPGPEILTPPPRQYEDEIDTQEPLLPPSRTKEQTEQNQQEDQQDALLPTKQKTN